MARIRTIKPDFWRSETLSALPESTHMLAAALLNYADDEGYFNANVMLIKAECFPIRDPSVSVQDSLARLAKVNYLRFGTAEGGKRIGMINSFAEHQRVNRPTPSKYSELQIEWDSGLNAHAQFSESSPPEGKGREGNKEQGMESAKRALKPVVEKWHLPDSIPVDLWQAFEEGRKQKKNPLTDAARTLAANKLLEMQKSGINIRMVMESSIEHGWATFYPPKNGDRGFQEQPTQKRPAATGARMV